MPTLPELSIDCLSRLPARDLIDVLEHLARRLDDDDKCVLTHRIAALIEVPVDDELNERVMEDVRRQFEIKTPTPDLIRLSLEAQNEPPLIGRPRPRYRFIPLWILGGLAALIGLGLIGTLDESTHRQIRSEWLQGGR